MQPLFSEDKHTAVFFYFRLFGQMHKSVQESLNMFSEIDAGTTRRVQHSAKHVLQHCLPSPRSLPPVDIWPWGKRVGFLHPYRQTKKKSSRGGMSNGGT